MKRIFHVLVCSCCIASSRLDEEAFFNVASKLLVFAGARFDVAIKELLLVSSSDKLANVSKLLPVIQLKVFLPPKLQMIN